MSSGVGDPLNLEARYYMYSLHSPCLSSQPQKKLGGRLEEHLIDGTCNIGVARTG
jgi:hypothetical protein